MYLFRRPPPYTLVTHALDLNTILDRTSEVLDLRNVGAMIITMILADKVGTVTFTPRLDRKLADGTYTPYWTAATAVSAAGTTVFVIGQGGIAASSAGLITEGKEFPLPAYGKLVLDYTGAGGANHFDTYAEVELMPR
jgi:hypothetical protein